MATLLECLCELPVDLVMRDLAAVRDELVRKRNENMKFQRETDSTEGAVIRQEVLGEVFGKILSMTNSDEASNLPNRRAIEMVLLALEGMPELMGRVQLGEDGQRELKELVKLVTQIERYDATLFAKPDIVPTEEAKEIRRRDELRKCELLAKYELA
ncbi:hypothetical protein [Burkholderia ubonensis]|uniref:hypothetical protein n=1 Tax=Burkholderia ubonensis TaxID=101571 RepID=UPI0012FB30BC|nr:hypothetical protein [Burkholderia ubonensis]